MPSRLEAGRGDHEARPQGAFLPVNVLLTDMHAMHVSVLLAADVKVDAPGVSCLL